MSSFFTVSDARRRLIEAVEPVRDCRDLDLAEADGRILADAILAANAVPPADNSAMDGYALSLADLATDRLRVSARIHAGQQPGKLEAGTAARIFTGAPVPAGADTVVMQEDCHESDGQVRLLGQPARGANIRRAGEDIAASNTVVEAGCRLGADRLGLLASTGNARVRVRRRPVVAVLSTGDELVQPGQRLEPGKIFNSNAPMLCSLVRRIGCRVSHVEQVPDTPEAISEALQSAAEAADLVISSGGVSVGEADHVRETVARLGLLDLWKIAVKPGKPLAFGRVGDTPFLGLPGNPVAVHVTFCLFAAPLIRKLQGRREFMPEPVLIACDFRRPTPGKREEYVRVQARGDALRVHEHQGSGVLSSVAWADGLARVPIGDTVAAGQRLQYFSYCRLLD